MKESSYNYFSLHENNKCLAYNTFTNGLAFIDNDLKNKIVEKKFDKISKSVLKELKKGGFIVSRDKSELDLLKIRYRQLQYRTNYLGLTIAPTMKCNMACKYCFETLEEKVQAKKIMDKKTIKKLIEFVANFLKNGAKIFHVTWFGGEPLLHPEIIEELSKEFIQLCDNSNAIYSASIITNGTLLTENNAKMLIKYKVKRAQVTIDGPEVIHNERRPYSDGKGTFQDIFNNLKEVLEILPINLRVNIDKTNINDTHYFFSLITKEPWFDPNKLIIQYGCVGNNTDSCKCPESIIIDSCFFQEKSLELNNYFIEKGAKWDFFPSPQVGCAATSLFCYLVGTRGELYKCWNHLGVNSKIVGTIFEDEIELSKLYIKYLMTGFENDEECQKCKMLPVCMGGCVELRMRWKDGKLKSKHCTMWKYNLEKTLSNFYNSRQKST